MKKITTLFCLSLSLMSCAQKEIKKEEIMNEENVKKVATIYKEVKTYDYNPQYKLHIGTAANFSLELLINDFPIYKNYRSGIVTGSVPINEAILKKGKQKLTVRMTPPVDKQFNMGTIIDFSIAELKLSIEYGDHTVEKYKDFKEVLSYKMPIKNEKLPYYEINLEFDAPAVPYENDVQGWTNSVDLSKEDKDKLLKEVETFYKDMISLYETKDVNTLAGKYYKRQKEIAQAHYQTKPFDSQIVIDEWIKDVNQEQKFDFKNNQMRFFGNGKIVALLKTDKVFFNYPALFSRNEKVHDIFYYYLFLHRPKPGVSLEVIR
jgi:hypothetical protein